MPCALLEIWERQLRLRSAKRYQTGNSKPTMWRLTGDYGFWCNSSGFLSNEYCRTLVFEHKEGSGGKFRWIWNICLVLSASNDAGLIMRPNYWLDPAMTRQGLSSDKRYFMTVLLRNFTPGRFQAWKLPTRLSLY